MTVHKRYRVELSEVAEEGGTYPVTISFADETGAAVVPSAATWTLATPGGTVINGREGVAISPLAAVVVVVLSGADLVAAVDGEQLKHLALTVEATINSDIGSNLPIKSTVYFPIEDLPV